MYKSFLCLPVLATALLAACGGGGGGGATGTGPDAPAPTPLIGYAEGDSYTYKVTTQSLSSGGEPLSSSEHYLTYTIRNPKEDLSHDQVETSGSALSRSSTLTTAHINSGNNRTSWVREGQTCTSTDAKKINTGYRPQVGEAWTSRFEDHCTTDSGEYTTITELTGKVTTKEPYQAAGATFSTFKVETERQLSDKGPSLYKSQHHHDCWYDERTGAVIACIADSKESNGGSVTRRTRTTTQLIGLNVQGHPVRQLRVERFVGAWSAQLPGVGQCEWEITPDGKLKGSCTTSVRGPIWDLAGSVSAQGALTAEAGDGTALAGTLDSALSGHGSWQLGKAASGGWTAVRQ